MAETLIEDVRTYIEQLPRCRKPSDVLAKMQDVVAPIKLVVLSAWRRPSSVPVGPDGIEYILDKNLFVHRNGLPPEFWRTFLDIRSHRGPSVLSRYAWVNRQPFTFVEAMRVMQPDAGERWVFELLSEFRFHDGLMCPVGEWQLAMACRKRLKLTLHERSALFSAAICATCRLEELTGNWRRRRLPVLSSRQQIVLYWLSRGQQLKEIGKRFARGESTVRTHLRRAQATLGARTSEQAIYRATRAGFLN